MRRSEQDQKRRLHRETDTPNVGTSRNSRRTSVKGNPIQVPSNNSYTEVTGVGRLAQKQKIIGNMHTKSQSRRAEKLDKPPPTRASPRIVLSKKKEDVIEIDSDPESHGVDQQVEPYEKPRKRRLIQHDPEEFAQEEHLQLPRPPRRKTANSPLNVIPSRPYTSSQSPLNVTPNSRLHTSSQSPLNVTPRSRLHTSSQSPLNVTPNSRLQTSSQSSLNVTPSSRPHTYIQSPSTVIQQILHLPAPPENPDVYLEEYFKHSMEQKLESPSLMLHSRIKTNEIKKFGDKYVAGPKLIYHQDKKPAEPPKIENELSSRDTAKNHPSPTSSLSLSPQRSTRQVVKRPLSPDPIDDYVIEPTGPDEHIFKKQSIVVYERDFERLEDETYLNDTLIDVFPKIWADEHPEASIYTFSSFFFTKLSGSYSSIHYDTVQRWTSSIDIFKKKYIVIPVAKNYHWFILLVVNPGYCIQGSKGLDYHDNFVDMDEETTAKGARKKNIPAGTALNPKKPYIMALDPLGLNKQTNAKSVLQYLKKEAITKLNIEESDFLAPEIVMAPCPGQDNFTDCGVFCLHYMKNLYKYPDVMMNVLYKNQKNDANWDLDDSIGNFRAILKRVLKKKMKDYREVMFAELMD